jgi:hypothetical protein
VQPGADPPGSYNLVSLALLGSYTMFPSLLGPGTDSTGTDSTGTDSTGWLLIAMGP